MANDHVSEPFRALLETVSPGAVNTPADVYARIRADARADVIAEVKAFFAQHGEHIGAVYAQRLVNELEAGK